MVKRIYIDTSVVGGRFDKEFAMDTIPFFDAVSKKQIIILVSDLLEAELLRAPQKVQEFLFTLPFGQVEHIKLSQKAADLADEYIKAKVVG